MGDGAAEASVLGVHKVVGIVLVRVVELGRLRCPRRVVDDARHDLSNRRLGWATGALIGRASGPVNGRDGWGKGGAPGLLVTRGGSSRRLSCVGHRTPLCSTLPTVPSAPLGDAFQPPDPCLLPASTSAPASVEAAQAGWVTIRAILTTISRRLHTQQVCRARRPPSASPPPRRSPPALLPQGAVVLSRARPGPTDGGWRH